MLTNSEFRIDMLGQLCVRQGSREIRRFRTQKTAALLAYLAFYKTRSHPRDVLVEMFWPDSSLEAGRSNLSVALNSLRRQLEGPTVPRGSVLIADRSHVRLNPAAFTTDVEQFVLCLEAVEAQTEPDKRLEGQVAALGLYAGDLLPGFYEDWILAERDRLRDAYLSVLRQVVRTHVESRQLERALQYAHRLVQADPLREGSYLNLMRLYLAVGRPVDALRQYAALEHLLNKELNTAPSPPLRELAAKARELAAPEPPPVSVAPSKHRHDTAPAPMQSPTSSTQRATSTIPRQFARFFGREAEIARLMELLRAREPLAADPSSEGPPGLIGHSREDARLVTLTGPGGTGKTRLSIEVARRMTAAFTGPVWFIPLADLHDPLLLGENIRDVLGLPRQIRISALDQVIAFLADLEAPALLILDNLEQISAGGAPVVWTLLSRVPLLRCLVTSRQPLRLPGEREIVISPLPTPGLSSVAPVKSTITEELLTYASVALFVDRAQDARPEFQITVRNATAIAAICDRLEGIPLAIELAATRARALTPSQILQRLDERFALLTHRRTDKTDRHSSLWAAMDWSYQLLPPGLQGFFSRLSVFRGGWTLEAAEAVCAEPAAMDYLAQLRGHSLVLAEASSTTLRFRMLETVREFAAEQLTPTEARELAKRHASYFAQWVADAQQSGPNQLVSFARFEEDLDNLRSLLEWSLANESDMEPGLRTAGELVVFWRIRGHFAEGRAWNTNLLERAPDTPSLGLIKALSCAGTLASLAGDTCESSVLLERARKVATEIGDQNGLALIESELGGNAYRRGDYDQARAHYLQSLELSRELNMRGRIAGALTNLASIAQATGDFSGSHNLHTQSLAIWRELHEPVGEARTLHNLAVLALSEARLDDASSFFEQSLTIRRELDDHYGISASLAGMAEIAKYRRDFAAATAYARESMDLARAHGLRANFVDIVHLLTEVIGAYGKFETATRLYGALERQHEEMNYALSPVNRNAYEAIQADLAKSLGAEAYEAARAEGRSLTIEQAIACLEETLRELNL